jgi:thiol-disulfide isomerase/thioredoxin
MRRGLGVAVLAAVAAIAFGWDSGILTQVSSGSTTRFEQFLITSIAPRGSDAGANTGTATVRSTMGDAKSPDLPVEGQLPSLEGATSWLNSPPLTRDGLRGKVVVIDFWTYSCINCLRSLPYVKDWDARYRNDGLVVIGVHAPEFAFEKDLDNVRRAVRDLGITYPVALDNDYAIWRGFNNQYWPAHYFIDALGRVRAHHFGEGAYDGSERIIRQLLIENGAKDLPEVATAGMRATGVEAAADTTERRSPETYVGYAKAEHFASPSGFAPDQSKAYTAPPNLKLNEWALTGTWLVGEESAALQRAPGRIVFRFQARDLHLVLGPGASGEPIRFRVTLDGQIPASSHGVDVDAGGIGVIREQRLYQLIRQPGIVTEHTFTIEFLDAGTQAYAFTFG